MPDQRWSWVFIALSLSGLWLITNNNRWGMVLGFTKELLWIAYALITHQYGFAVSGTIFAALFARGFVRWSQPKEANDPAHP